MQKGRDPFQTLYRYIKKEKTNPERDIKMKPHYDVRNVFTEDQQRDLADCINTLSKMCHGLSATALRQIAFEMAEKNTIETPALRK
jgi:hypothetical protein